MAPTKTGTAKTAKVVARRASPPASGGMSSSEMLELMKEPLNAYEQAILDAQIKKAASDGKTPRQLNIAVFTRSCMLRCKASGRYAANDPPPHVPADAWNDFLTVNNDAYAILRSMDKEDYAYWEHRCKILHAHHRAQFPDYTFAPKHLPREEKVRRHEEKNRIRMQKGLKPVEGPKPRGRPSTKNRGGAQGAGGIDVPDHIFTHGLELKSVALPTLLPIPPHSSVAGGVSPTSPGSQSSFTAVESTFSFPGSSSGTKYTELHASQVQPLMDFGYQFPTTTQSRDDGMAVYDTMLAARRPSQVAVQFFRGGAASDRIVTVPLPSLADTPAPNSFDQFRGFGATQHNFGAGLGLDVPVALPPAQHLPHQHQHQHQQQQVLMGEYISQRRNSEFRFPPPMRVFANQQHQHQQEQQQTFFVQPAVHEYAAPLTPVEFAPAPSSGPNPNAPVADPNSLWTTANPFAAQQQQQQAFSFDASQQQQQQVQVQVQQNAFDIGYQPAWPGPESGLGLQRLSIDEGAQQQQQQQQEQYASYAQQQQFHSGPVSPVSDHSQAPQTDMYLF